MKKVVWVLLALFFLGLIGYKVREKMLLSQTLAQQTKERKSQSTSTTPAVKALPIFPQPIKEALKLVGNIEVETEIAVQPRVNGRLVSLLVEAGQPIKKGELIGEMDDEAIKLQLQQSEANLAGLKANLQQSQLSLAKAKAEKDRYQELLNKRYISQRDYDNVENSYLMAGASEEAVKAQLQASTKNYDLLKLQLNQTKLYSPVNGYVITKMVTPGVNLTTGTTVITVAALDPVKLVFMVDQKDSVKIKKGIGVSFTSDAFQGQVFSGRVNQVAPILDPKTRTLVLSASIVNSAHKLVPGMFGTAEIMVGGNSNALVVPQEAIIFSEGQQGVFVVESNVAQFRPVRTGLIAEGQVEIISGVKDGDSVVVIGQNRLRDGQKVQLIGDGGGRKPKTKPNRNNKVNSASKGGGNL